MRKLFLSIIFLILIFQAGHIYADDQQRMISSGILTSSQALASSGPRTLYGLTLIATGYSGVTRAAAIADSADAIIAVGEISAELEEAAQYDTATKTVWFEEGLKMHKGIYLYLTSNAKAIVYYY